MIGEDHLLALDMTEAKDYYSQPKFESWTDFTGLKVLKGIYQKIVKPNMVILDLFATWDSHFPKDINLTVHSYCY